MFLLKNAQENATSRHFFSFPLLLAALPLPLVFSPFNQDKVTVAFFVLPFSTFLWDGSSLTPAPVWTHMRSRRACPREAVPAQAPAPADRPAPVAVYSAGLGRRPGGKLVSKTQHLFPVLPLCFH